MGYKNPVAFDGGLTSYGAPVRLETCVWGKKAICFFVDGTNGSDNETGKSWKRAVATLSQAYTNAIAAVATGNPIYIYVAPGTYTATAAIAVTYPYVYWMGAGYNQPYGGNLCNITETDQVSVWTLSALADGGGIFGFNIACTPTTTTVAVDMTGACGGYTIMNNTFVSGDGAVAYTAIDGTGDYEYIAQNRFVECKTGISSAGTYAQHRNNIFIGSATVAQATSNGIKKVSGSSYGDVVGNWFDYVATDADVVMLSLASGANYNRVQKNIFNAVGTSDPILNSGTGNTFHANELTGTTGTIAYIVT